MSTISRIPAIQQFTPLTMTNSNDSRIELVNYYIKEPNAIQRESLKGSLDNACSLKISLTRYIICLKSIDEKFAVLGELNQRYIDKNRLNDKKIEIRKSQEMVPLPYIYDKPTLTLDLFLDDAKTRLGSYFDYYCTI